MSIAIIPIKFAFNKIQSEIHNQDDVVGNYAKNSTMEHNSIVDKFHLRYTPLEKRLLDSQALIQLKSNYCSKNKCLHCAIGSALLNRNS